MAAPPGAIVRLYYDSPRQVVAGDAIRTPTGRGYQVLTVRRQVRGRHAGRWHLGALVLASDELAALTAAGATVHPIAWYARSQRA